MIKLDLQSRLPIYEQLKNKIGELVLLGELKPGDQLPSVRSFARELGINPNTVQKAYQDLERDGVIFSVTGRGSYVSHDLDIGEQLREEHLKKVRKVVKQARVGTVPEQRVLDAVREVYKEGDDSDTDNQSDQAL